MTIRDIIKRIVLLIVVILISVKIYLTSFVKLLKIPASYSNIIPFFHCCKIAFVLLMIIAVGIEVITVTMDYQSNSRRKDEIDDDLQEKGNRNDTTTDR